MISFINIRKESKRNHLAVLSMMQVAKNTPICQIFMLINYRYLVLLNVK